MLVSKRSNRKTSPISKHLRLVTNPESFVLVQPAMEIAAPGSQLGHSRLVLIWHITKHGLDPGLDPKLDSKN